MKLETNLQKLAFFIICGLIGFSIRLYFDPQPVIEGYKKGKESIQK